MDRRQFLLAAAAAPVATAADSATVETVTGPVPVSALGTTLLHEHVLVDFSGLDDPLAPTPRYDRSAVFKIALPKLRELAAKGCRTLVECTPAYLGRDPALLKRLAVASGLHILTNTGYYGAADDKFVPKFAYTESPFQLADRWTREVDEGIGATGIRPAFLKIGVDSGQLSAIDAKLVGAAILCHRRTGLRMHIHTGNGAAARAILNMTDRLRGAASGYVWVHAQNDKDYAIHGELAAAGCWIEFDGINAKSADLHLNAIENLTGRGWLSQLLISQDSGWYRVGEPTGGEYNGYTYLFDKFVPALRERGFADDQIGALLVTNPARVLTRGKPAR